jgi:HD domain
VTGAAGAVPGFRPETELERRLAADPVLAEGLAWGKPRSGHPEGRVAEHVADLVRTLDTWGEPEPRRAELRFMALVHDALKYKVQHWRPRTGENHHAMRARRLAERYTGDERLLAAIELHDRPYAIWRRFKRSGRPPEEALDEMLARVPDPALFLRFVELDGSTDGKDPEPVRWLTGQVERRGVDTGSPSPL